MKIGLLGLTCWSGNKGCEALSYSFLSVLDTIAEQHGSRYEVISFENVSPKRTVASLVGQWPLKKMYPVVQYKNIDFKIEPLRYGITEYIMDSKLKKCNVVFDFTAGDSFTDIYGADRARKRMNVKERVLKYGVPLVLGSQTIGPFVSIEFSEKAAKIMKSCLAIFVRDELSYHCVKEICGRMPVLTCDVAFALPYEKQTINSTKIKVGFNPSGLLWSGGYTHDNQFGLSVDYQYYCKSVIKSLIDNYECEIHLISHSANDLSDGTYAADNDDVPCKELLKLYPDLIVEKRFKTPMDAKSCISGMDFFIGARMHATIAAVSSGIPTIPFSYSRKFEGLYSSIGYPYIVKGTIDDTDKAIKNTLQWFEKRDILQEEVIQSRGIACEKLDFFVKGVDCIISQVSGL